MSPSTAAPLKHYLQFSDLNASDYAYLFERAALIKKKFKAYDKHQPLIDRTLVMIFEKASTRTRVSFEAGMYQLGGTVVNLTTEGSQLGRAEPIEDSAKVISRMVDLVMIRTFEQTKIERFAEHSRVPVINGLTNEFHPCQILADIFTYIEHRGSIQGKTVTWVGDGNNMVTSWIHAAAQLEFELRIACPPELSPSGEALGWAKKKGARVVVTTDPFEAVADVDCVNADTWVSMGDSEETANHRHNLLAPHQGNARLMAAARRDAIFMHCLPARRGEEMTADVIDGPASVVFDEAENRLHAQKALLCFLLQQPR